MRYYITIQINNHNYTNPLKIKTYKTNLYKDIHNSGL